MTGMKQRTAVLLGTVALLGTVRAAWAEDRGGDYVSFLIRQLKVAPDDDDREDAAEELGKIGDPRALHALENAAIYDEEDDVREDAQKAVRRIQRARRIVVAPAEPVVLVTTPVVHREVIVRWPVIEVVRPVHVMRRTVRVYRRYHRPAYLHSPTVVVRSRVYGRR